MSQNEIVKPRKRFIMLSLCFVLLLGGQFVFSLGIAVGKNFEYAQREQRNDASPEIKIAPRVGASDRYPDDLPLFVIVAGIAFLSGFRIAAWMGKRQIERLKRVWRK